MFSLYKFWFQDPVPSYTVGDVHDKAMTYISYIGCAVSIFGLAVTIVTYSMFRFVFHHNWSDVRHQNKLYFICIWNYLASTRLYTFVLPFENKVRRGWWRSHKHINPNHCMPVPKTGLIFPKSYVTVVVQWFEVIVDCLFCWYWWNSWQSLFKLSFHNFNIKIVFKLRWLCNNFLNIYLIMWSCPGNMPKYYPGLSDILPDPGSGNMSLRPE